MLVDMVPHLSELVPDVQLLYVGMTLAKQRRAGRLGLLERVRAYPATADEERLALFYSACDVVVNASAIGESQGVAIAEAMALGVPVVTCSTPWADNAQVEIVDHGVNGWIANHPRPFAEAVADLLLDDERQCWPSAPPAAAKVARLFDPPPSHPPAGAPVPASPRLATSVPLAWVPGLTTPSPASTELRRTEPHASFARLHPARAGGGSGSSASKDRRATAAQQRARC